MAGTLMSVVLTVLGTHILVSLGAFVLTYLVARFAFKRDRVGLLLSTKLYFLGLVIGFVLSTLFFVMKMGVLYSFVIGFVMMGYGLYALLILVLVTKFKEKQSKNKG